MCIFAEPEQLALDWKGSYTKDEWPDQVPPYRQFAPAKLDELLAVIGTAIDPRSAAISRCGTPRWWSLQHEPMPLTQVLRVSIRHRTWFPSRNSHSRITNPSCTSNTSTETLPSLSSNSVTIRPTSLRSDR